MQCFQKTGHLTSSDSVPNMDKHRRVTRYREYPYLPPWTTKDIWRGKVLVHGLLFQGARNIEFSKTLVAAGKAYLIESEPTPAGYILEPLCDAAHRVDLASKRAWP